MERLATIMGLIAGVAINLCRLLPAVFTVCFGAIFSRLDAMFRKSQYHAAVAATICVLVPSSPSLILGFAMFGFTNDAFWVYIIGIILWVIYVEIRFHDER